MSVDLPAPLSPTSPSIRRGEAQGRCRSRLGRDRASKTRRASNQGGGWNWRRPVLLGRGAHEFVHFPIIAGKGPASTAGDQADGR